MIFFDGAFGTYYNQITNSHLTELANINNKETVLQIHKEYIEAGVDYIETNTYNANYQTLKKNEVEEVIKNGFLLAKKAVENTNVKVLASIGYDHMEINEYKLIVDYFLEAGADKFIFETFPTYDCLISVINYIKEKKEKAYIILSFSPAQDGYTETGEYYKDLLEKANNNKNIDLLGLNCSIGPSQYIKLVKQLNRQIINKLLIMPNANYPVKVNNRLIFRNNSNYFCEKMEEIYKLGIKNIGGCCGTTPEHIKKTIDRIKEIGPIIIPIKKGTEESIKDKNTIFTTNKKLIAVELDSPINHDFSHTLEMGKKLKSSGVDIITIADSPLAKTRMDSLISSVKIKRDLKIEVLPHINCRDKNTIGIKAGILGIISEDINNCLVITGDPIVGRKEKGVFELNSFNMISYINSLNKEIFPEKDLMIFAALNVNSNNFQIELKRSNKKIENGASCFLTQPIYEEKAIENLILAKKELGVKIFGGILPIASYRNGMFLNNEVGGINIPEEILNSLNIQDKDQIRKRTMEYSKSIIDKIYSIVDGFYIMIPLKKVDLVTELVTYIKDKEKNGN